MLIKPSKGQSLEVIRQGLKERLREIAVKLDKKAAYQGNAYTKKLFNEYIDLGRKTVMKLTGKACLLEDFWSPDEVKDCISDFAENFKSEVLGEMNKKGAGEQTMKECAAELDKFTAWALEQSNHVSLFLQNNKHDQIKEKKRRFWFFFLLALIAFFTGAGTLIELFD